MYNKNKSPLVSIIIPCYNYEKYIEKCIQSVLSQTYENIEVLIVDNGSTDNSLKKIKTFENDKRVIVIKLKENIAPGDSENSAFTIAFNKSNGDYIGILYADDWYLPNKIQKQIELFDQSPNSIGVVYCHGYRYFEDSNKMTKWKMQSARGYVFKDYLANGDVAIPISPLVKRYCYDIIGVNNIYTGSEYDHLTMSQYVNFDFVDDYLVAMREHKNNDAKNILSVYKRVRLFHEKVLLSDDAKLRAGKLVNKRVARDYKSFGLKFITMLDMKNARIAMINSLKIYPLNLIDLKLIISLFLIFAPLSVSKFILKKFNKLSVDNTTRMRY